MKDYSHIKNPTVVYNPAGAYALIETNDLDAAYAAGWSSLPPEWAISSSPPQFTGEIDFTPLVDEPVTLGELTKAGLLAHAAELGLTLSDKLTKAELLDALTNPTEKE